MCACNITVCTVRYSNVRRCTGDTNCSYSRFTRASVILPLYCSTVTVFLCVFIQTHSMQIYFLTKISCFSTSFFSVAGDIAHKQLENFSPIGCLFRIRIRQGKKIQSFLTPWIGIRVHNYLKGLGYLLVDVEELKDISVTFNSFFNPDSGSGFRF